KEVTDHKDHIRSLDLDYVDAVISRVNPGTTATKVSGTLKLRKAPQSTGNDIKVGDLQDFALTAGSSKRLNGTPELDAFLLQQLHEQGTFYAVIDGTVDGAVDVVLDVTLHASLGY